MTQTVDDYDNNFMQCINGEFFFKKDMLMTRIEGDLKMFHRIFCYKSDRKVFLLSIDICTTKIL